MRSVPCIVSVAACVAAVACSSSSGNAPPGGGDGGGGGGALTFQGQVAPLAGVSYDTGLQPPGSPAQAQLKVSGNGNITVTAAAAVQGGQLAPTKGSGTVKLDLHFLLAGHLKVDTAFKSYDGDIPGLMNVDIAAQGNATFDPFLIGAGTADVTAPIPATQLPDIPLGMIPGKLQITIADGSVLKTSYQGACVAVAGGNASYKGQTTTSGSLLLKPTLALDAPISKSFPLPDVTVNVPGVTLPVDLGTQPAPGAAATQQGMCPAGGGDGGMTLDGGMGSDSPTSTDSGTGSDGGPGPEGSVSDGPPSDSTVADSTVDGGACYQNAPFTPFPWQPPTALHQNACSSAQQGAYVMCATTTGDCSAFRGDPANAGCVACIETDIGATQFGPVVTYTGIPAEVNWGGCAANLDGNTSSGSCGNQINNIIVCNESECGACTDFGQTPSPMTDACVAAAGGAGGQCAPYLASPSCVSETADGGTATTCFSDFGSLLSLWCGP